MHPIRSEHMVLVDCLSEQAKEELTLFNKFTGKQHVLWEDTPEGVWVPRRYMGALPDPAPWEKVQKTFKGELREEQKPLVKKWLQAQGHGIISAGTGTGKTVMGIWLACKIPYRTLIVVPTERIFDQWIEEIHRFTDVKHVGIIRAEKFVIDRPIVVAMIHTLALSKRYAWEKIRTHFGFVIWDECHRTPSDKFQKAVTYFWDKYRLGLSATPYRKDGLFEAFTSHIGGVVAHYKKTPAIPRVVLIYYYNSETSSHGCYKRNKDFNMGRYFNKLAACEDRTKRIVDYTVRLAKKGRRIIILCDRVAHVDKIVKMLRAKKIDAGYFISSKKEPDRQVLVATHGSAGLGMNIEELDTLILASPRADIAQAVGRILRRKDINPLVIDIVDSASKEMRAWAGARVRFYKEMGCEIKTVTVA